MNRKTIIITIMLLFIGLGGAAVYAVNQGAQPLYLYSGVAEKPLRLHILANSDSSADQQLKLALRDYILAEVEQITAGCADKPAAMAALSAALPQLQSSCNDYLRERAGYQARLYLRSEEFPEIDYGAVTLAAGEYDALRIVLGEGRGHNWWCVLFPPLCFVDAAGEFEQQQAVEALAGGEQQQQPSAYTVKFKLSQIFKSR
ncbi:MAG: stage II sporulation protein R [Bacillota bacterium]|nr:stage II sporulation protein R [Bacillota bacterium]